MKKLAAARAAILAAPLGIGNEDVLTFAEKGKVEAWRGDRNRAFQVTYTGHIVVTGYAGAPQDLLFFATEWFLRDNPGADAEAIRFHVDIIDHKSADVSLMIELTEIVAPEDMPEGLRLALPPDPDAQAFDTAALTLGLDPD
jgi:hypothetical protein